MDILGIDDIEALFPTLYDHIYKMTIQANLRGELDVFFDKIGFPYQNDKEEALGRILVIGQSQAKKYELVQVAMNKGFDPERIDYVLTYEDINKIDFNPIKKGNQYETVLVGPMSHKQKGSLNSSSMIAELESAETIKVIRVTNSRGKLDISKTSFSKALSNLY